MTHSDSDFFSDVGRPEETGSNTSFLLSSQEGAWRVEEGHVNVFAVRLEEGRAASRRKHLFAAAPGQFLFGTGEVDPNGYSLIAVGTMGTVLRRIEPETLYAAAWDAEYAGTLSTRIDEWIENLSTGVFPGASPKEHEEPPLGELWPIQEGACVRSVHHVRWVRHVGGASLLRGNASLPSVDSSDGFVPVGTALWLQTTEVCELEAVETRGLLEDGSAWTSLQSFHVLVRRAVSGLAEETATAARVRLMERVESDRTALGEACGHLASVMDAQVSVGATAPSDPLLAACRIVGDAVGVEIQTPQDEGTAHEGRRNRLKDILRASRLRSRKVALRGQWWTHDAGPLIGLLLVGDEETRSPVALLPDGRNGYSLHDPAKNVTLPVSETVADTLHPFAYSLYRPFRDEALNAWDVFKFGAKDARKDFSLILSMGVAGGILGMLTPIMMGVIFNQVIPGSERVQLGQIVFALVACAIATAMFQLVRGLAVLRVESKMDASVQSAVWDRLLNLPTSFFRRFAAGDLAVRAGSISQIRKLLSGATISSLLSGVFSVFQLALLFYYDAGLAWWALGLTTIALFITAAATYTQLRYQRIITEIQSSLSGMVLQFITGITKLRVAGAESKAFQLWSKDFSEQRSLQFKARRVGNGLATFNSVFPVLSLMVIFAAMTVRENASMPTGDFIAFNAALGTFTASMLAMTSGIVSLLRAIPYYEQAKPILEAEPEIDRTKSSPGALSGEIELQHINFRYEPDGALILNDLSIDMKPGEFVALVGPSGSGKSTVLRVLLGFEEPEAGAVYYSGQDLSGLDIQAVRRQIGVVLQSGRLMSGDLFTNITGSSMATMDDAWEAARMAGFDEDIKQMPMGMHTVVSEGGSTLSGGQRQRLMIARAIVRRPRLLFFDEATSALDNRTQRIVSESLDRLEATRIVVAHRLSTIINADRIYVLNRGRVVQHGPYEKLLDEGGLFADLVERQLA